MKLERSFLDIKKRIAHNIIALSKTTDVLFLDDVLLRVGEAVVYLDTERLSADEWKQKHVFGLRCILNNKRTRDRFRNYTREALLEALRKEWLDPLSDDEELKRLFLVDVKLVEDVNEDGVVSLNTKLYELYDGIPSVDLQFGIMSYTGESTKRTPRAKKTVITSVKFNTDVEAAISPFITAYCEDWDKVSKLEEYKWKAVQVFEDNFDLAASDLPSNLKAAMSATANLLVGSFYFPLSMLVQMAQHSPDETRMALRHLFDEKENLSSRCEKFLNDTEAILEANKAIGKFKSNDKSMQSVRSISVYLSLRYPSKHYLYKQSVYYDFRAITGADLPSLNQFESVLVGYEMVCDELREILLKNERLVALHDKTFPNDKSNYHLLTQDFLFYCTFHYQNR